MNTSGGREILAYRSTADDLNSSQGPALTSSNGKVVMAWKGVEGDQRLFWASTSDRGDWDGPYSRAEFNTSQGPALAVL